jgi:hypothetical protein
MATRKFRLEFIREVMECGEVARIPKGYDHGAAHEDFEIVFRSKDDGKHYAFEYNYNGDHGIDRFDGWGSDDLVDCWEVQKKEVTTTTWVAVG